MTILNLCHVMSEFVECLYFDGYVHFLYFYGNLVLLKRLKKHRQKSRRESETTKGKTMKVFTQTLLIFLEFREIWGSFFFFCKVIIFPENKTFNCFKLSVFFEKESKMNQRLGRERWIRLGWESIIQKCSWKITNDSMPGTQRNTMNMFF